MAWMSSIYPRGEKFLREIESHTQVAVTPEMVRALSTDYPEIEQLSAQVWGSLVGFCEEGPFEVIDKGPRGAHCGLEALRRLYARWPTRPGT